MQEWNLQGIEFFLSLKVLGNDEKRTRPAGWPDGAISRHLGAFLRPWALFSEGKRAQKFGANLGDFWNGVKIFDFNVLRSLKTTNFCHFGLLEDKILNIFGKFLYFGQLFEQKFWWNCVTLRAGFSNNSSQMAQTAQKTPKKRQIFIRKIWKKAPN